MTSPAVISLKGVSFSYNGVTALEGITLDIQDGEMLGIVGPNGGGKSTLLKIILGLLSPDRGTVTVFGRPPVEARREIGYVPQSTSFPKDFPISVEDTVLLGRLGRTRAIGGYSSQDREAAAEVMKKAEVLDLKKRRLGDLSGGQVQRVLIARSLASRPKILILDEPTAHMDLRFEEDIFELLKALNDTMTIVVVSHDVGFISHYVTRAACLNRSLVCHQTVEISQETMNRLYGAPVRIVEHEDHQEGA
jgi:zinc transport system ATP-binding protein